MVDLSPAKRLRKGRLNAMALPDLQALLCRAGAGMSVRDEILAANLAFYRAFESLDLREMEKLWLREPGILCIHPGWGRLAGWGPIMASWERIFESTFDIKFDLAEPSIRTSGDLALVVVEESVIQRGYDGALKAQVLTTNAFHHVADGWLMVLNHGSPIVAPVSEQSTLQ